MLFSKKINYDYWELGEDSVTNLHYNMVDVVNVIMHIAKASTFLPHEREKLRENYSRDNEVPDISGKMEKKKVKCGDALWNIFCKEDISKLHAYLNEDKL